MATEKFVRGLLAVEPEPGPMTIEAFSADQLYSPEEALRLLEDEELKTQRLRKALEAGEQSGMVTDFDAEGHLRSLHRSHR